MTVYDHGKPGVLDAKDEIALEFRDEHNQVVGSTERMSLKEFGENSVKLFQAAFKKAPPKRYTSRLFLQTDLPIKFSYLLAGFATFATQDKGLRDSQYVGELKYPPHPFPAPANTNSIKVYVKWETNVDPKTIPHLDKEAFGIKISIEFLSTSSTLATIGDEKNGNPRYVLDHHALGNIKERKQTVVTQDPSKGYMQETYIFDPKKDEMVFRERSYSQTKPEWIR